MEKRKRIILGTLAVIVITIITMIVVIANLSNNQELIELQKVATIKYFENCMNVRELYLKSENTYTEVNEPQFLEIQLKLALDKYFKENAGAEYAPADKINESMWNPHGYQISFSGLYVTGYTYNAGENTFTKSNEEESPANTDALMQLVGDKIKGIDNQELKVDKIEKIKNHKYIIYANLLGYKSDLANSEETIPDLIENIPGNENLPKKEIIANAFITIEIKEEELNITKVETKNVE